MGSTDAARRAGNQAATSAINIISNDTTQNVSGSTRADFKQKAMQQARERDGRHQAGD